MQSSLPPIKRGPGIGATNRILVLALCVMPTLLFVSNQVIGVIGKKVYDGLLALLLLWLIMAIVRGHRLRRFSDFVMIFFAIFIPMFAFKWHIATDHPYYIFFAKVPFMMEMKPIFYFLVAILTINIYGPPSLNIFELCVRYFAVLIIMDFCIRIALGHHSRPAILDESNYDNLIVMAGFISYLRMKNGKYDGFIVLYLLATLASQSRTGMACFAVIFMLNNLNARGMLYLMFAPIVLVVFYLIAMDRGGEGTVEDIDRFRMWKSYFSVFANEAGWLERIWGFFPGVPIRLYDPDIQYFIETQTEKILGEKGLHPFNYHGMWLRIVSTWGIAGCIFYTMAVFLSVKKDRSGISFIGLVFLQGISMGVFYLSTVSFILIMFVFALKEYVRDEQRFT